MRPRMPLAPWSKTDPAPSCLLLSLAALLGACSSTSPTTTAIVRPTLIAVSPADIFPQLPCNEGANSLQSYVATLHDVTPGLEFDGGVPPFELPSSAGTGPTPCSRTSTFSFVAIGRRYSADVDGYDRSDLHAPTGDFAGNLVTPLGSHTLLDPSNQPVEPRWSARCGYVPGGFDQPDAGSDGGADAGADPAAASCIAPDYQPSGVLVLNTLTRYVVDCVDAVSVKLTSLGWSCGGPGGIDHFNVESGGKSSCEPLACAREAVLQVAQLAPGVAASPDGGADSVTFTVRAFAAAAEVPLKQATCTASVQRGLVQPASCSETPISAP